VRSYAAKAGVIEAATTSLECAQNVITQTCLAANQQMTANVCVFLPSVRPKFMHTSFFRIGVTTKHSTYAHWDGLRITA